MIHQKQLSLGDETPAMFLRYNPHTFHKHGLKQLISGTDKVQAEQARQIREKRLVQAIIEAQFGAEGSLKVLYMYYNCYLPVLPVNNDIHTYHLNIWLNPVYHNEVHQICMPVIV